MAIPKLTACGPTHSKYQGARLEEHWCAVGVLYHNCLRPPWCARGARQLPSVRVVYFQFSGLRQQRCSTAPKLSRQQQGGHQSVGTRAQHHSATRRPLTHARGLGERRNMSRSMGARALRSSIPQAGTTHGNPLLRHADQAGGSRPHSFAGFSQPWLLPCPGGRTRLQQLQVGPSSWRRPVARPLCWLVQPSAAVHIP